jgi:archaemetzincin
MIKKMLLGFTILFSFGLSKPPQNMTIVIQPFEGMPKEQVDYITKEVKKIYPYVEVLEEIPLPKNCMNFSKSRYRANLLIEYLDRRAEKGTCVIGLTHKDISSTKGKYADWGVMGLGYCPGKACIISNYRVKGTDRLDKLYKLSIHELGHTQGLPHCPSKGCIMQDAKGKDRFSQEYGFCKKCTKHLKNKNWEI